jgi:porphobilinogen synthase
MLNAAFEDGLLEKESAMIETLYSFKRAGSDIIITYFAKEAAKLIG